MARRQVAQPRVMTPTPRIQAMAECVQPTVEDTVTDPACGTAGSLLGAHAYAANGAESTDPTQRLHLRDTFVHGGSTMTAPPQCPTRSTGQS